MPRDRRTPGAGARGGAVEEKVHRFPAYGPLGARVRVERRTPVDDKGKEGRPYPLLRDGEGDVDRTANALVLLQRLAFEKEDDDQKLKVAEARGLLNAWAAASWLGQGNAGLLKGALARRHAFVEHWRAREEPRRYAERLELVPEWRIVTGVGLQYGELESGLAMHGTYGWPVIPASTLKGVAGEGARIAERELEAELEARDAEAEERADRISAFREEVRRILGDPRPGAAPAADGEGPQGRGSVRFLDALPGEKGVKVYDDVITPHQQPYYTDTMPGDGGPAAPRPPAEHHNPVPVPFLSVSGTFHVDLLGDDEGDLRTAAEWLERAGDESGIGGRTTAGYGYFTCRPAPGPAAGGSAGGGAAGGGEDERPRRKKGKRK
ncbi:type III-B CRISPR module RAMP protein Cmr6 [Nocardiopsis sp. RSe5-2]|uniref:Type III-B CRISPR module RAMP protein Cmr6 n=1 Tax=Nocardiopsis endophytica TaxID=3018445 RepID=A0ABT4U6H8_9ACTN|nr:type III-B CRISPR module RAMP protein Cmr6 [Nocardiopsis endophytica]MDA2812550.1 type III-B CRISPR module RAMP protein Cmr6 [Nocardiopsis endophytica]